MNHPSNVAPGSKEDVYAYQNGLYYWDSTKYDSDYLIDAGQDICGCPTWYEFFTWVYVSETFDFTMNLDWDDDLTVYVWNSCGDVFDPHSCQVDDYCNNDPGTSTITRTLTEGWNVIKVGLFNDIGQCRAGLFDSYWDRLSADPRVLILDSRGAYYHDELRGYNTPATVAVDLLPEIEMVGGDGWFDSDPVLPTIVVEDEIEPQDAIAEYSFYNLGDFQLDGTGSFNPEWDSKKFDRWGYYLSNGRNMKHNREGYGTHLRSDAWSLSDIIWPSGSWTTINYENDRYKYVGDYYADPVGSDERDDTHYGGGVRVSEILECQSDECSTTLYLYNEQGFDGWDPREDDGYDAPSVSSESSGVATYEPGSFEMVDDRFVEGHSLSDPYVGYSKVIVVPDWDGSSADFGWTTYQFTTALDSPNDGVYVPPTRMERAGWKYGFTYVEDKIPHDCVIGVVGPAGHTIRIQSHGLGVVDSVTLNQDCNAYDSSLRCGTLYYDHPHDSQDISDIWSIYDETAQSVLKTFYRLYHAEEWYCGQDHNNNRNWDLLDMPVDKRTSGSYDRDYGRGLLTDQTVYSSSLLIVADTHNEYESEIQTQFGNGMVTSASTQLIQKTEELDGITKTTDFEYNPLNGKAQMITETNSDGEVTITKTRYAYSNYNDMFKDEHMWSQPSEIIVYKDSDTLSNRVFGTRTTYHNDFPSFENDGFWLPHEEYEGVGSDEVLRSRSLDYNKYSGVLKSEDAEGNLKYYYYGDDHECGSTSNPDNTGDQWSYSYVTCEENDLGQQTTFAYDSFGNRVESTDPNGVTETLEYDVLNRLDKRFKNGVLISDNTYYMAGLDYDESNMNSMSEDIYVDDSTTLVTTTTIDGMGREHEVSIAQPTSNDLMQKTYYTSDGSVDQISEWHTNQVSAPSKEEFVYDEDPLKRMTKRTHLGGESFSTIDYGDYTNEFRVEIHRNENNVESRYYYDAKDQLRKVRDAEGYWYEFDYDRLGNLERVENPLNEDTVYTYDTRGLIETRNAPESGLWTYAHDDQGNLDYTTDARGLTIDYDYDELNRMDSITYPNDADVDYIYDEASANGIGKLTKIVDGTGQTELRYNDEGLVYHQRTDVGGEIFNVYYYYDNAENLRRIDGPSVDIEYSYDDAGRVDGVTVNDEYTAISYTDSGMMEDLSYPNGVSTHISYNDRDMITSIDVDGSSPIFQRTYKYDNPQGIPTVGNLQAEFFGVNQGNPGDPSGLNDWVLYEYDDLNRLTLANIDPNGAPGCTAGPDCEDVEFDYDGAGNRIEKNGVTYLYVDPASESRLMEDGTHTYSYDENGNVLSKTHNLLGTTTTFTWNDANRLARVEQPGGYWEEYSYDANGNRVMKTQAWGTTYYLYDKDGNLLAERFEESI